MFERYTERARRALFFARYEASHLGGSVITSEHLLLGLQREGKGLTSRVFAENGLDYDAAHREVERAAAGRPKLATSVEMPLAADTKAALEGAAMEADALKHAHIGTEHLLLGLLRAPESSAGVILSRAGLRLAAVRESIVTMLASARRGEQHIVLVQVTIRPEMLAEFESALLHNARESVLRDPGCLRFDVAQDKEHPEKWVLYEVYDSPDAHATHRQSPHFLAYDAVAARAVVEKVVSKCAGRHVT
jgi:ATP-dependent Clp protease ATP-binding subunit ClpC